MLQHKNRDEFVLQNRLWQIHLCMCFNETVCLLQRMIWNCIFVKVDSVMVGPDEREEVRIQKGGQVISYFS